MGKGDAVAADHEAAKAMHRALNDLQISVRVALGEGSREDIPLLYTDEILGGLLGLDEASRADLRRDGVI